jgi:hypothetical protein
MECADVTIIRNDTEPVPFQSRRAANGLRNADSAAAL